MSKDTFQLGTGRRKTSVARVRIRPGTGRILVNGKPLNEYFSIERHQQAVLDPLRATKTVKSIDVWAQAHGGGVNGQVGAMIMGLGRALLASNPEHIEALRTGKFLTRDSRMTERKKYGRKKARKSFQFSKR